MTRSAIYVTSGNNYSVPPSVAACQAVASTPAQQDACLSPDDHIDSVLSLNMDSGTVKWSQRFTHADTWTTSCESYGKNHATPCPVPTGLDTDFGAGANLFTITSNGQQVDAVGAGQKSGSYFTMNRDTGAILRGGSQCEISNLRRLGFPGRVTRPVLTAISAVSSGAARPTISGFMCRTATPRTSKPR